MRVDGVDAASALRENTDARPTVGYIRIVMTTDEADAFTTEQRNEYTFDSSMPPITKHIVTEIERFTNA